MAGSLADQLLKAGLVDKQKANKAKKAQYKKQKQQKNHQPALDDAKLLAAQVMAAEKEKSRQLNLKREAEAKTKAIAAQIKQLIENNTIPTQGDIEFKFVDGGKIKKLYVSASVQNNLNKGFLVIAKFGTGYALVPSVIAEKIGQRDQHALIRIKEEAPTIDEDDPYADYPIPDDLMW